VRESRLDDAADRAAWVTEYEVRLDDKIKASSGGQKPSHPEPQAKDLFT